MLTISDNYNIQMHNYKKKIIQPTFRSNYQLTEDILSLSKVTRNATCFFRSDLDWKKFCKLILKTFKNSKNANIVCVGCSDGSEPTSLLLKLLQFKAFRNEPQKFKQIKAYDIDEKQIEIAKSYKIPLINNPLDCIFDYYSLFKHALKGLNKTYYIKNGKLELAENLKEKIQYEIKEISEVINNLPRDEKVVLLARNIFPYLDDFFCFPRVMQGLSKLKKGSVLAIGDFDKAKIPDFEKMIMDQGYEKSKVKNCFIKK